MFKEYLDTKGEADGFEKESDDPTDMVVFRKGSMYDFSLLEMEDSGMEKREPGFPSFPLNSEDVDEESLERGRLKISSDAADFFTEEGEAAGKARHNGTVLHDILSRVRVLSDLEASVNQAIREGDLEPSRQEDVMALLSKRIAGRPEWFPSEGGDIRNERSLIDTDGQEWRPDRVIVKDGKVTIIDYKFGDKNSRYKAQVGKYAAIYRRLGFKDVTTAIWYVPSDVVE